MEYGQEIGGGRHGTEDATLHFNHFEGREVVTVVRGSGAVRQEQTFIAPVIGVAHGSVDANIGGDARQDQAADAPDLENQI